ncbi:hypothetical protein V6N12_069504 [Hibiscus sabdariffa]|uniref:Uncharacterized protein n=1 Tax=Hibiscus sabdariffa TaxID=183260 RepID=A0ABR2FE45_9ROSI
MGEAIQSEAGPWHIQNKLLVLRNVQGPIKVWKQKAPIISQGTASSSVIRTETDKVANHSLVVEQSVNNVTGNVSDGNTSLEELSSAVPTVDNEGSIIVGASIVDDLAVDSVGEAIVESVISVVLGSESELQGAVITDDLAPEGLQSHSITVEEA